jgi:hypothetical protein
MSKPKYVVPNTLQLPSTASSVQIYATIRDSLIRYTSTCGERLEDFIGEPERIYIRAVPTPVQFPYITLLLNRTSQSAYNGYREVATLEVQCIGKPESQLPLVESAMDIVDQCLTSMTDARSGLVVGRSRNRQTLPMFTTPADSSVVGVLAIYDLFLWPVVLTSRASAQ